jgi:hypothetical protein
VPIPTTSDKVRGQTLSVRYALALIGGANPRLNRTVIAGDRAQAFNLDRETREVEIFPYPGQASFDEPPATTIRYSQDAVAVFRRGVRARDIAISGTVGPVPTRLGGAEPVAESVLRAENLRAMGQAAANDPALVLRLYAINEQRAFDVELVRWRMARQVPQKTLVTYTMTFRALREVEPLHIEALDLALPTVAASQPPLRTAADAVDRFRATARGALDSVRAVVDGFDGAWVAPVRSMVDDGLGLVEDLNDFAADLGEYTIGLITLPARVSRRASQVFGRSVDLVTQFKQRTWDFWADQGTYGQELAWRQTSTGLESVAPLCAVLRNAHNTATAGALTSIAVAQAVAASQGREAYATVRGGDTIFTLAARLLGSAARWGDLVDANALRYPYVGPHRSAGVLAPGDYVRAPAPTTGRGNTLWRPQDTPDVVLFGRDFRADNAGDFALRTDDDGAVDFDFVAGEPCYLQSQAFRIGWERGENLCFPERGIPAAIGRAALAAGGAIAIDITNELRADSRVAEVRDVVARDEGNALRYDCTVVLASGTEVPAAVASGA